MIDLGKYTIPVLSAYGASVLLLVGIVWQSIARNARARRALDQQEARRHG